jgi:hypothetical protein
MSKPMFLLTLRVVGTDIAFSTKLRPVISNVKAIAEEIRNMNLEGFIQGALDHGGGADECVKEWNTQYAKAFGGNNHWPVGHSWPSQCDMSKTRAEVYASEISYQDAAASTGNFFVVSRDMPRWEMNPEWDLRAAVWEFGHILGAGYATSDEAYEATKYCRLNAPGVVIERKDLKPYTECKTHQEFHSLLYQEFHIPAIPIEEGADELIDSMMERLGMNKIEYIDEDDE